MTTATATAATAATATAATATATTISLSLVGCRAVVENQELGKQILYT